MSSGSLDLHGAEQGEGVRSRQDADDTGGAQRRPPEVLGNRLEGDDTAGRKLTLWLDLPPKVLSSNGTAGVSKHFSKRHKVVAAYRATANKLCYKAMREAGWDPALKGSKRKVFISSVWYLGWSRFEAEVNSSIYYRPRDEQNAHFALKAAFDGFCDAHLVYADTAKYLRCGPADLLTRPEQHGGRCGIEISIVEVNA